MAEALRIYAFEPYAARSGSSADASAGVTLTPRRPRAMLNVRGAADDATLARALTESFGIALPSAPNSAITAGATRALALGPDEWLLVVDEGYGLHGSRAPAQIELPSNLGGGTITDVSHGRATVRIRGSAAREALAAGCAIDLHPRAFPPDRCAQTAIARVSVILDHVADGVFDLYCPRSYAGSFWHWLTAACAEYGYRVEPPA